MKKEEFKPWCIICGKGFATKEEAKAHLDKCISESWLKKCKENENLKKQNAELERRYLELKKKLRK